MVLPGAGNDVVSFLRTAHSRRREPHGTERIAVIDPSGDDTYEFDTRKIAIGINDGSGIDWLDFSPMPAGVTVDLAVNGPQQITPGPTGVTLTLAGTFENVIGSEFRRPDKRERRGEHHSRGTRK